MAQLSTGRKYGGGGLTVTVSESRCCMNACVPMAMVQSLWGIHYHALLGPFTIYVRFGSVSVSLALEARDSRKVDFNDMHRV